MYVLEPPNVKLKAIIFEIATCICSALFCHLEEEKRLAYTIPKSTMVVDWSTIYIIVNKLLHNPTSQVGFSWRIIWRTCCLFVHLDILGFITRMSQPNRELYNCTSLPYSCTNCLPWTMFQLDWITLWKTIVRHILWHLLWGNFFQDVVSSII